MDLKPQNLFLTGGKPVLKVGGQLLFHKFCIALYLHVLSSTADFGMAQHLRAGDFGESFRGSPLYMVNQCEKSCGLKHCTTLGTRNNAWRPL